jgi:hypothetical protein
LSLLFAARRLMLELTGRAFNAPSIQADEWKPRYSRSGWMSC